MRTSGFTLVEMVVVLIILAILAVVAIPRMFNLRTFEVRSFYDESMSMLRYAQKIAIAQNRNVHVRLNGTSIALCFTAFAIDGSCGSQVPAPTGTNSGRQATLNACANSTTWFCEASPANVTYITAPITASFYFSPLGKPYNPADNVPDSTFNQQLSITITGEDVSRQFFVEQETGYVHP